MKEFEVVKKINRKGIYLGKYILEYLDLKEDDEVNIKYNGKRLLIIKK